MPRAPELINDTTYEVTLLGGDKVEIGDKESTDFKPHIKLNRWDGECFIKVGLSTSNKIAPILEGNRMKWVEADLEAHFYSLEPRKVIVKGKDVEDTPFSQCGNGGFEFEVILKKKPATNKVVLNIEAQGLNFYYQPPLTQQDIDEGCVQPDSAVGSYAVYHATKTSIHQSKVEAEKYKCGKAFHIYRPKIVDAAGNWIWGELSLDKQAGTLTTTIPQDFLDSAVYPVSTGTTNFGYETKGTYGASGMSNTILADYPACGGSGNAISMTFYGVSGAVTNVKMAIYDAAEAFLGGTAEAELPADWDDWKTLDFAVQPEVEIASYYLCVWGDAATNIPYDLAGNSHKYYNSETYGEWPEDADLSGSHNRKFSIYCTYGAAEEGGAQCIRVSLFGISIIRAGR